LWVNIIFVSSIKAAQLNFKPSPLALITIEIYTFTHMSSIKILLFVSVVCLNSCGNNTEPDTPLQKDTIAGMIPEIDPQALFENNCAMCHGLSKYMTAPAIISYSIDSIMNYYDGKSATDSIWTEHKQIELTREEWRRIAIQYQPGCY
jgi:hypothetical protein